MTTLINRKQVLGTDPKKGYNDHEGEVGVLLEKKYGDLKRDPTGDAEWLATSGAYKGNSFDLLGIPKGKSHFHSDTMERFLPSVDAHFRKQIDYVVLDTRYMTLAQKNTVLEYVNKKYLSELNRLIILE